MKEKIICKICNRPIKSLQRRERDNKKICCESCYKMCLSHPINKTPSYGEMAYDNEGRVICHICGRAFHKLSIHLRTVHQLTAAEYREQFGLNKGTSLVSERLRGVYANSQGIKNLEKHRHKGQFKSGHTSPRLGKEASAQTIKERTGMKYRKKNRQEV